jgi:DNA-binding NarL/FixJ family response regulator
MAKKTKKKGLPKSVQEAQDKEEAFEGKSPEEFAKEMFGEADKPQEGLPTLEWLKQQFQTKSACIRYLHNQGIANKVIAKHLGVRYQQVRNVVTNPLKRGPNEDWRRPELLLKTNQFKTESETVED